MSEPKPFYKFQTKVGAFPPTVVVCGKTGVVIQHFIHDVFEDMDNGNGLITVGDRIIKGATNVSLAQDDGQWVWIFSWR